MNKYNMNQSNGSSIQTVPPENIRSYTKYIKRYFTGIMIFCFVVGTDLGSVFKVDGQTKMTFAELKDMIYERKKNKFEYRSFDSCDLNLWLVNIPYDTENVKLRTLQSRSRDMEEENIIIELGGKRLSPIDDVGDIFTYDSKHIRIIVQPPPPATTVSSMHIIPDEVKIEIKNKVIKTFPHINNFSIDQLTNALALIWNVDAVESDPPSSQNDPCIKLKMEPSFFKINLPGAITQQSAAPVDLCLPPYVSKSGMNFLNPCYDDPQFKKTVSLVREKLIKNPKDITVLAGVSGGGKTSTAFGISIQRWTIYVDFTPSAGQYGDFMGQELERIRARPPMYDQAEEQSKVFDMLDSAIVSRGLLLIKMLVQENISTQKEWLFAQLRMNTKQIKMALRYVDDISSLFYYIVECLNMKRLILIFDEAQVLCSPVYGEYKGSSLWGKRWNLLQAYIDHLTHLPVTCLIASTYMHMASGISLVTSIGKIPGSHAHIVLKLPLLSQNDVRRNLEAVIDLTGVTPETYNYLIYVLSGRPRNCASFVRKLISERKSTSRTKDQEIRKLIRSWLVEMSCDMAEYLENTCKYVGANNLHPEKAIMDVLRLRVFYNQKFSHAIELLKHSIIPCISPDCIMISHKKTSDKNQININPSFESYFVSGIEEFFLRRGKTLVDVFVNNIIFLNDIPSIGNEFDAVFITAIIQKRGYNVQEELNKWKNGQKFDLPSWITPTMKFKTTSNLSGTVPLAKYVNDKTYYRHAIQPEIHSGSDLVLSLMDDEQNVILLSASCTVSVRPIKKKKIEKQLIKSCMKCQYMECPREKKNKKNSPCLQTGLGDIPTNDEEDEDDSVDDIEEYDIEEDDIEEDDIEENNLEEDDLEDLKEDDIEEDDIKEDNIKEDDIEEDDIEEDDLEEDNIEEDDIEEDDLEEDDLEEDDLEEDDLEEEEYKQDLDFGGVDYDLDYTENTKKYRVSRISEYARNHEKIKTSTENRRHIYISVELPCRQSKRPRLFRINEYGDLVIIVDNRNMEYVFGSGIKKLVERISENQGNLMDETNG